MASPRVTLPRPDPAAGESLLTASNQGPMMRARAILSGLTLFAAAATSFGQTSVSVEAFEYRDFPINVQLPASPMPVPLQDGRWLLSYHLFFSNWAYTPVTLKEFQVLDADSKAVVLRYDERDLSDRGGNGSRFPTVPQGRSLKAGHERELEPGESAAIVAFAYFDNLEEI